LRGKRIKFQEKEEEIMEELLAPMAGKIMNILVKVGDAISEDDELLKLDAMKMENPIYAPVSGVIKDIRVKENDEVEADDLIMIIG
jgi:acetyl-CoA carboxylase biotin carboxyl carrier protein